MLENHMKQEISVSSGEINACRAEGVLRASAIGSCVVVAAYDAGTGAGGMAHVMLPGTPIKDAAGEIIGAVLVFQDITERRLAEAKSEHTNRVLRAIRNVNQLIVHEDRERRPTT